MRGADHHHSLVFANLAVFEVLPESRQRDSGMGIGLKSVAVPRSPRGGDLIFADCFYDPIYAP